MMTRSPSGKRTKGGVDARDVEQLIGGLGRGDPAHRVVHHCHGDAVPVEAGVADDVIPGNGALQIVLEELADVAGIGTARRRKEAASKVRLPVRMVNCLVSSTMPERSASRLGAQQVGQLQQVLQKLGDQLTGRRGIGLVEVEGRIGDIGGGPAVVVDDRHLVAGEEQILRGGVCSGRLVSTTTRRERESALIIASCGRGRRPYTPAGRRDGATMSLAGLGLGSLIK